MAFLGFRFYSGLRFSGLGFRVLGFLGFRFSASGLEGVWGFKPKSLKAFLVLGGGFRVEGLGFRGGGEAGGVGCWLQACHSGFQRVGGYLEVHG